MSERRLHLLKVVVQPTFVLVDEEGDFTEITGAAMNVVAKDWRTWSATAFKPDRLEALLPEIPGVSAGSNADYAPDTSPGAV